MCDGNVIEHESFSEQFMNSEEKVELWSTHFIIRDCEDGIFMDIEQTMQFDDELPYRDVVSINKGEMFQLMRLLQRMFKDGKQESAD